jgi:carbon storage regulator
MDAGLNYTPSRRRNEMLVLSRKLGQKVQIGGAVTLTILGIERGHVRVGIDAPEQVRILRSELIGGREEKVPEPTFIVAPAC